jgi:O-antigen/teichoic acid export membrane protein
MSRARAVLTSRPFWTLVDQGLVSVGNFLSGVIIVHHMPKTGYGAYALLLETMLFLNSLQNAVITYPMSVRGATHDATTLKRISTAALWMTFAILPLLGLAMALAVCFGAAPAAGDGGLFVLGICAAAGMVLWQMQETVRRALMAELRFQACIPGDAISYLGQVCLLLLVASAGRLTLPIAFVIIGVTSACALTFQSLQIGLVSLRFSEVAAIAKNFWKLGSWTLLATLAGSLAMVGSSWTLKIFGGLDANADYAAMIMPTKLANPVLIAMGNLMVPGVAKVAKRYGRPATVRVALRYAFCGAALVFVYYGLIAAFPTLALGLVLGKNSPYLAVAGKLRVYQLYLAAIYIESVLMAWLYGLGESRANFTSQMVQGSFTLVIALPAAAMYGLYGLILGNLTAASICIVVQFWFLRKALGFGVTRSSRSFTAFAESLPALD